MEVLTYIAVEIATFDLLHPCVPTAVPRCLLVNRVDSKVKTTWRVGQLYAVFKLLLQNNVNNLFKLQFLALML